MQAGTPRKAISVIHVIIATTATYGLAAGHAEGTPGGVSRVTAAHGIATARGLDDSSAARKNFYGSWPRPRRAQCPTARLGTRTVKMTERSA